MSSDPVVDRCLELIRAESRAFSTTLAHLAPAAWDALSNCPPWRVRDLAAHVVISGEGFARSVERGLAGSVEPAVAPGDREKFQQQLAAATPIDVAQALDGVTDRFAALYDGLGETGLAALAWHRRGNRPVRWYAAHRLAEVAFHRWDLQVSLGDAPDLAEEIAALLLPTLIESNAPRTYAAGLSAERGSGERYLLRVVGDPDARWLVTIDPDELQARRGDYVESDVTISGSAAALALLVYGRRELSDLFQIGALRLDGDAAVAERFPALFPRP